MGHFCGFQLANFPEMISKKQFEFLSCIKVPKYDLVQHVHFPTLFHYLHSFQSNTIIGTMMIFLGKTYDVYPNDSQRSHPLMNLGVSWTCVSRLYKLL